MDVQELLKKYKAGRRPPLDELVSPDLLKIFHRGLVEAKLKRVGIALPVQGDTHSGPTKWPDLCQIDSDDTWEPHCMKLREWENKDRRKVFKNRCYECDMKLGCAADERKETVMYLCHGGMVDFATPVVVDSQTIAVLFTGQLRPAEGRIWSKDFINKFATRDNIIGSEDAWVESLKRHKDIMSEMQASSEEPPPDLVALSERARLIRPDEVPNILQGMHEASAQLASLAETTIRYELNIIKAYFTSQVANLLPQTDEEFWPTFSHFLSDLAQFYGLDYGLFYMLRREIDRYMYRFTGIPGDFPDSSLPLTISRSAIVRHPVENCRPLIYKPQDA